MTLMVLGNLRKLSSFCVINPSLCFSLKQRFPLNDLLRVQNAPETLSQTSENPLAWRLAFCLIIRVPYIIETDPSPPVDLG